MAKFKGIVKLSHSQYKSLKNNGSLTVGDQTIIYDPVSTLYVTRGTGEAGGSGLIDSISVDGVRILPDDNKNVNIDLSGKADKSDIQTTLNEAKAYTNTKVADLVNSAPETLDTLGEVAKAIQENDTIVEALNSAIGNKADKTELEEYVKNTEVATTSNGSSPTGGKLGLTRYKAGSYGGLSIDGNGCVTLFAQNNPKADRRKGVEFNAVTTAYLNDFLKEALAGDTYPLTLTAEEKIKATELLGALKTPALPSRNSVITMNAVGAVATTQLVHESPALWTVPCRDDNGCIKVATPKADLDATNKKYVDDLVGDINTALESILGV